MRINVLIVDDHPNTATTLARAIYAAAISEHPDRLIVLARGAKIIARSAD